MARSTRWILNHKLFVVPFWIILTVVGLASAQSATKALSTQFTVPGGKGITTSAAIARHFGNGGNSAPIIPVITLPEGATVRTPVVKRQLATAFRRVAAALPGSRVASYASTGDAVFISRNGHTTFGLVYPPASLQQPAAQVAAVAAAMRGVTIDGAHFKVTGLDALSSGTGNTGGNGIMAMTMGAGITALVVLIFVFGSALAIVPLLMALVAIPTTFLVIWALASVTYVSFIVEFLVSLIGLGVSIDYSLLVIMRWREERANGAGNEQAVIRAMETAGRSVIFSGGTVAIGLCALMVLPLPFLRSMGYGGMLIPLVTVVVVLTLLPVVLATVGPFLDWPRRTRNARPSRIWTAWALRVVHHPWIAAILGLSIMTGLLLAGSTISLGTARVDSLASAGPAHAGLRELERSGIGSGVLMPFEILVQGTNQQVVARRLAQVQGVLGTTAPSAWQRAGFSIVDAIPAADGSSSAAGDTLSRVRAVAHALPGTVRVGGGIAGNADFTNAIYGNFPLMIVLIVLFTFLVLLRAFHSVLLAFKAVLMNLVSVMAAWGILVLIWQDGFGARALWGIPATGEIDSWIPMIVFAFLFGLSMDYEVFLLSRVREAYDDTGSTEQAVVTGIGRVGRLITGAALILFLAFITMTSGPETQVKMLGTGLAAGILLDATVMRMLLVPALVVLFGKWNWWMPGRNADPGRPAFREEVGSLASDVLVAK